MKHYTVHKQKPRIISKIDYSKKIIVNNANASYYITDKVLSSWCKPAQKGKIGRPSTYSDEAILSLLQLKIVFKLDYRKLYDFAQNLTKHLDIAVPSYTQIFRRGSKLKVEIPDLNMLKKNEPIHVLIDSKGLNVFNQEEWQKRQQNAGKYEAWRQIHICLDESTKKIVSMELGQRKAVDTNNTS